MKRLCLALAVVTILIGVATVSKTAPRTTGVAKHVQILSGDRNPWTNLQFNDKRENFHFVIVTDRTGGRLP